jgi:hypothetical protein
MIALATIVLAIAIAAAIAPGARRPVWSMPIIPRAPISLRVFPLHNLKTAPDFAARRLR